MKYKHEEKRNLIPKLLVIVGVIAVVLWWSFV
jgi:hypothetical protein